MTLLSLDLTFHRSDDLLSCDLDGETVLLSVTLGQYFHMNESASRVWELLAQPATGSRVCEALQHEYAVDRETCSAAVRRLLGEMCERGLVEAH